MVKVLKRFFIESHRNKRRFIPFLLGFLITIVATVSHAKENDQTITFSTGFDYSSGSYGLSKDTDILYIPFTLKYKNFPWKFKLTVPYVRIKGPGGVIAGADGVVVLGGGTENKITTEEGIGDVVFSSNYALDNLLDTTLLLDLTAKVKIGTADETKGLGTGKNDYSLQLDLAKKIGKTTPFATLGYKIMGDPEGIEFKNVWYSSIGFDYEINSKLSSGISFDSKQAAISTSKTSKESIAYLNWKLNSKTSLMGYGVVGFSDGSPDNGIGLQISIKH